MHQEIWRTGNAAELYIASIYTKLGYSVLWPLTTQSRYDLVVEKEGQFIRVQCKKATWAKNSWYSYLQSRISSRNKGSKPLYKEGEFDEFAFTDDQGRVWIFPFKELEGLTSVCLDSTNPKYKCQAKQYKPNERLVWPLTH